MANPVDPKANLPAISSGGSISAIVPTGFMEVVQMAEVFAKSEMVPTSYRQKPQNIVVAIMYGMEVGLPPLATLQNVAVVNGRPTLYGDGQLAVCQSKGQLEEIEETVTGEGDKMEAKCRVRRRGITPDTIRTFSAADAKKAGLLGKAGPWTQYPKRMLQMRARSFTLRDAFADHLLGISAEEAQDTPVGPDHARDITPAADKPRPTSRLDALEGIIEAEAAPESYKPGDIVSIGGSEPQPVTIHDPETGEIKEPEPDIFPPHEPPQPSAEEIEKVTQWANETIRKIDTVVEAEFIDRWLAKNKDQLARAHSVNSEAAMAVVSAAHARKAKIEQDKFHGEGEDTNGR